MVNHLFRLSLLLSCGAAAAACSASAGTSGTTYDPQTSDAAAPVSSVVAMAGDCTVTTTAYGDGAGSFGSTTKPIALSLRVQPADAESPVSGTVLVSSPWDTLPAHLWRAWCNIARGFYEPLTSACSIGEFEVPVGALDFGEGYVVVAEAPEGLTLTFSSAVESPHDNVYGSYTRTAAFCKLAETGRAATDAGQADASQ